MGRKNDINSGAVSACFVVAIIGMLITQSFLGGVIVFAVICGILCAVGIIR